MSRYYNYCENIVCKYCNSDKLVQLSSDITCTGCGADQYYGNFVHDQANTYYDNEGTYAAPSTSKYNTDGSQVTIKIPNLMFDTFVACAGVPENVIEAAKIIYTDYISNNTIRGEKARWATVMACIYYASRAYTPVEIKDLVDAAVFINEHDFSKACREIKEALSHKPQYKAVMITMATYDITHNINKAMSRITSLSSETLQGLRSTIFTLVKYIKMTPDLESLPQMTIAVTLIYIATRKKKVNITLKALAQEMGVTTATIMKTETKLFESIKNRSN